VTRIRRALPEDTPAIVELVKASFHPRDLDMTVFGCLGFAEYVRGELSTAPAFAGSHHLVAESEKELAGYVEMRKTPEGVWLNYVATAAPFRGRGVGGRLVQEALRSAGVKPGTLWQLDVFEANQTAYAWYRRLGFEPVARGGFWRVQTTARPESIGISGLAQADALQRIFGFSTFSVLCEGLSFTVGRLGPRWLRITDLAVLHHPGALAALQEFDPGRELLLSCAAEPVSSDRAVCCERLLATVRMRTVVPDIVDGELR